MTLNEIITRAASVYPDCWVLQYWSMDKQCAVENRDGGDTLAQFIAREPPSLSHRRLDACSFPSNISTAYFVRATVTARHQRPQDHSSLTKRCYFNREEK